MAKEIEIDGYIHSVAKDNYGDRIYLLIKQKVNNWDLLNIKVPSGFYLENLREFDTTIPVKVRIKVDSEKKEFSIEIKLVE